MKRAIGILFVLPLLAACGDRQASDSGVTAEESEALNEAEKMLDDPDDGVAAELGNSGDLLVTGDEAINAN